MSASVMKEDEKRIRASGFDSLIPKPIDKVLLLKELKNFLKNEEVAN
jgi:CheY-like chemotaxis protein